MKERDTVCGMSLNPKADTPHAVYEEGHCYFCSDHCKSQFDENPKQYL